MTRAVEVAGRIAARQHDVATALFTRRGKEIPSPFIDRLGEAACHPA